MGKSWNAGAERLYGFAPEEAVGRSSHSLLQTTFPIEFIELRSHLRNERYWSGELRHICKDGHEVTVDSRMQLFGDDSVLEVNRDVTEAKALFKARKQFEHALRESEQQLRWLASIVESSDDVIISKDLDGIIISWNKGAEHVFGYTAEEAIGQPITIVIPEDRHDEERQILTRIRRGERIDHYETVRRRKHGSLVAVSLTVSPVRDAEGKIVGASKIARDITEQRRSQEQIATLAREAEHRRICWRPYKQPCTFLSLRLPKDSNMQSKGALRRSQTFTRYLSSLAGLEPSYPPSRSRSLRPYTGERSAGAN
jgi:PAS domain S-box-containing protein